MFHDIVHGLNHILHKNKELTEIYVAVALRKFAVAMFGIFVPIYLYFELNYSLSRVGVFFVATYLVTSFSFILASMVSSRIGFKRNMLISSIVLIIALAALYFLKTNPIWFYPAAILFGAAQAMFWYSVHADMVRSIKKKKGGSDVSWVFIFISVASIIGPFLAGIILDWSGFKVLFAIVTAILILSSAPLFLSRDVKTRSYVNLKEIFSKINFGRSVSYFSEGAMHVAAGVLWPLLVFIILKDYVGLGTVFSLVSVLTPFVLVFAGKFVDRTNLRKTLIVGALFFGSSVVMRAYVDSFNGILIVMSLGAVSWSLLTVAMHKNIYVRSKKNGDLTEVLARELIFSPGRIFILLILIFSGSFFWSLVAAGLSSLLFLWFR